MASFSNWTARHGHALVSSGGHLARHAFATTLTVIVMGLALALPLALDMLVNNVRGATGDFSDAVGLSVYLKPQVSEQTAKQLAQNLSGHAGVAEVTLITAAQALEEFRAQSGFGAALDALTDNPLPNVLAIRPARDASSPAQLETLRRAVEAWPEVDSVQLDRDWLMRFNAILELMRRAVWITAILLAAGVIAVVGNTIRLEIRSRAAEIEVTQLVGGSRAFVRRPFLYTGVLYGLIAAAIAWGIVAAARVALAPSAEGLAAAYGQKFVLAGPNIDELGALVLAGVALGWIGAALASAHEIARTGPRHG
ncbi:MAG TPA: permease-like cell division protein FtsX [Steroidobacteraceae bacterium]